MKEMPTHDCTDCDGRGGVDVIEPDEPVHWWACEGCGASGRTTSCSDCGDPMSLPEAEFFSYRCVACRSYWSESDYQAELAALRAL